jgi:homoserine O-acetyltransferase/O-succinyltransferase
MRTGILASVVCCLVRSCPLRRRDIDVIVKKETFNLEGPYHTINDGVIKDVKIGYEAYGKLSAEKDNVILLCHGSINTKHFAGKYDASDPHPGVWDHVIGPGKILDTDKYFVIASDSLTNFNVNDPHVITTGPASPNPDNKGEPYGMDFPIVTIADFVEVQKRLLDSLGIHKLHAVMGASMGGMQTMEWAARYPDMVPRAIVVTSQAEQGPFSIELKDLVTYIIKLDPNWKEGKYYGKKKGPEEGLFIALKALRMTATSYGPLERQYGRKWEQPHKNPAKSWDNKFAVQVDMDRQARDEAKKGDANSWIYIARALNLFQTGHQDTLAEGIAKIKAKVLFVPSKSDLLMFPDFSRKAYALMKKMGKDVDIFELEGDGGHYESAHIDQAEKKLRAILK